MRPVTAKNMSEIDRRAREEYGISETLLMKNAGRAVFDHIIADQGPICTKKIAVFCGKGNNGGDGFVIARHLENESPGSTTIFAMDADGVKEGAANDNYVIAKEAGISIEPLERFLSDADCLEGYDIVVDALFGTGFRGELPEALSFAGKIINSSDKPCYAVDVPSGLNATTGNASSNSLKAFKTITFGLPKTGFFAGDGPDICGEVIVVNIGFPEELLAEYR